MLHTGCRVEVVGKERPGVSRDVAQMLPGENHRGDDLLAVALEPLTSQLDHRVLIMIKDETVLRAIDTKPMDRGSHLRGEGEIGSRTFRIANDDPEFVDDVAFPHLREKRT